MDEDTGTRDSEENVFFDDDEDWDRDDSSPARILADRIVHRQRLERTFAAERYESIDALRRQFERDYGASWTDPDALEWRDLRAEVAAALQIHERSAQVLLDVARGLVQHFPDTLQALHDGDISERNARILVEQSAGLSPALFGKYEARLLPDALLLVPSRFERLARTVKASLEPDALIRRHREALGERRTALEAAPDGMAWFGAYLAAEDAVGAAAAVTGLARGLMTEGEERTLAQIEADVFRDLIVDAAGVTAPIVQGEAPAPTPAASRGVKPEVLVTVPVLTAMGRSDDPGNLDGYGPIDADTARTLCGYGSSFLRVLTDPEYGAILNFGRKSYRVPTELRRFLRARDEVCRFVGCTRNASLCEIDHTIPWSEDGETVITNLAHVCKGHHRLKERGRWRIDHNPGGIITWKSPTGRVYTSPPAKPPAAHRRRVGADPLVMTDWLRSGTPGDQPPF